MPQVGKPLLDFRVAKLFDFEHVWAAGVLAPPRRGGDESCPGAVVPLVPPERAIRRTRAAVTKEHRR